MARPPARAGGRSGSLTGGKSGKRNGFSPPFPKGYLSTSPARPAGGRAATGLSLGGPQARYPVRGTASPTQLHQRRESRGKNLFPLGFFPPFLPKKWGPGWASQGSLPFQRRRRNPATRPARSNGAGAKHKKPAAPVPGNRWFSLRSGLSHSAKLCTDPCRQSMETFIPSCRVRVAPMAPTMTALFRLRPTTAAWLPSPFSSVMIPAACRR